MTREIKFRIWSDGKMDYTPETFTGWLNDNFIFDGYDTGKEPIVMQFTGLLDKLGKEIYEGDVLKGNGDFSARAIVEWEGGGFHGVGGYKHMGHSFFKDMEIIGNIYENPELL